MRAHLPILPLLATLVGAVLVPILALWRQRIAWPLAVAAGLGATLAAAAGLGEVLAVGPQRYAVGGWPPPWGIEVVLDFLSAFVATVVASVATLGLLTTGPAVRASYGEGAPAFYALALVAVTGFLGIIASGDLFNVFVFLEIAAIASYALVASGGGLALAAAFRYVVLGTVGASFYLLGVGLLYALTGTLNMADLADRLPDVSASPLFAGGVGFVVVGLAIKMGLFPLHGWLPDTYTHAPGPVAALLPAVATKAAAYALARCVLYVLRPWDLPVTTVLAWTGGLAVVAGGVMAIRQADARRLLAYSSVSQMGYVALGLGVANSSGLVGAYLHILNHALMKATLFIGVGAALLAGRGPALPSLGLGRAMPVTATCMVIAALSMVGVPPAGGFFSKWYLLRGAVDAGEPLLVLVIVIGSLLAAIYMYRLTEAVWFADEGSDEPAGRGAGEAPWPILTALIILTVATLAVGLGQTPLVERVLVPAAAAAR
jgi:multicomponent Na+:H+ antiporter subunit D